MAVETEQHPGAPAGLELPPAAAPFRRSLAGRLAADRWTIAFLGVLAVGAVARFWDLGTRPGWQPDEPVYASIGRTLLLHGTLNDRIEAGLPWAPFLFHPPFYFLVLDGWFRVFGAGIPAARALSVVSSLVAFALVWALLRRLYDVRLATITTTLLVFDGWLLFVERVSYIENTLMVLVVLTLVLYRRALEHPTTARLVLAGASLGATAVFKQTGAYLLVVVLLHAFIRRDRRAHLAIFGTAFLVIAAYVSYMGIAYDYGGHDWFVTDTLIQLRRTFGLRASGGTLTSPLKALHLLSRQYAVFLPSLLVAISAFVVMVVRVVQCVRRRSFAPVEHVGLLFAWSWGAVVTFAAISLRFPEYFVLVLVPLYCYLYVEAVLFVGKRREGAGSARSGLVRRGWVAPAAVGLLVALGLGSATLRVYSRHDNALGAVAAYARAHIPHGATVITIESIGDEIPQPWCDEQRASACASSASYVITYTTFLQGNPPDDPAFYAKLRQLVRLATFRGFKETVTVWGP